MLVRFEIIRAFELASHTKEMANKKAKTAFVSTLLARKNSPKTSGVRIKIAPSFAKTTLHKAHKTQSAMKRAFALMMSVSNSYATPIATPPNMIVYASGGYRFADFARIGIPLKVVTLATIIGATLLFYPL